MRLAIVFLAVLICSIGAQQRRAKVDDDEGEDAERSSLLPIPGQPRVDYPTLASIPLTKFHCRTQLPGYYADQDTACQVFHVCHDNGRQDSFLCPNGTIFSQKLFSCDWWYNVACSQAAEYYSLNQNFYTYTEQGSKAAPESLGLRQRADYATSTSSPTVSPERTYSTLPASSSTSTSSNRSARKRYRTGKSFHKASLSRLGSSQEANLQNWQEDLLRPHNPLQAQQQVEQDDWSIFWHSENSFPLSPYWPDRESEEVARESLTGRWSSANRYGKTFSRSSLSTKPRPSHASVRKSRLQYTPRSFSTVPPTSAPPVENLDSLEDYANEGYDIDTTSQKDWSRRDRIRSRLEITTLPPHPSPTQPPARFPISGRAKGIQNNRTLNRLNPRPSSFFSDE